ncbi:MAG: hypothetical protein ABSG36_02060 [Acidimicrobiales bacterium]|jgi:hypothetical protein
MRVWQKMVLLCSLPVVSAGLGYFYVRLIWRPPLVGHRCESRSPVTDCLFHPVLVSGYTWMILGALAAFWFAYVFSRVLLAHKPAGFCVGELAVVTPVVVGVVWWTLRVGLVQAGTRSEQAQVLAAISCAILARLVILWLSGRAVQLLGSRTVWSSVTHVSGGPSQSM